jgi:hypothetical protein
LHELNRVLGVLLQVAWRAEQLNVQEFVFATLGQRRDVVQVVTAAIQRCPATGALPSLKLSETLDRAMRESFLPNTITSFAARIAVRALFFLPEICRARTTIPTGVVRPALDDWRSRMAAEP